MNHEPSVAQLAAELAASGSAELRGVSSKVYLDEELFALESKVLFVRQWTCVGRAGEILNPGDYFTVDLRDDSIVVIRQDDGDLRAFRNACPHRFARLLEGEGSARRIVCPYHAWSFRPDGSLVNRPLWDDAPPEAPDCLFSLRCETWLGFVFVTSNDELPSASEVLAGLTSVFEGYGYEDWVDSVVEPREVFPGNWKLLFENFIESYHLKHAHRATIKYGPDAVLVNPISTDDPAFSLQDNPADPAWPEEARVPRNPDLPPELHGHQYVAGVYPNLVLATMGGDSLWWIVMLPQRAGENIAKWGASFPPALAGKQDLVERAAAVVSSLNQQDKVVLAAQAAGVRSGVTATQWLHSSLEPYVAEFHRWIGRSLLAADLGDA